jgi:flagellar hook protein FlgE
MDVSFSASLSGMQASSTRHDITANDVANINTPGYEEYRPIQTDVNPAGTRIAAVIRTPNPDKTTSGTDLATESVEQIENKTTFSANAQMIKAKDKMLGTLLDIIR